MTTFSPLYADGTDSDAMGGERWGDHGGPGGGRRLKISAFNSSDPIHNGAFYGFSNQLKVFIRFENYSFENIFKCCTYHALTS